MDISSVSGLKKLEILDLTYSKNIEDDDLVHLENLTNLKYLYLGGCSRISDDGITHLKKISSLKELYLFETRVSDAGIRDLQRALPDCKVTSSRDPDDHG